MQLALLLFLAATPAGAEPAQFPDQLRASAIQATVRIDNVTQGRAGSGVIIGRGGPFLYFLTAAHVVGGGDRLELTTFSAGAIPKAKGVYRNAEVVAITQGIQDLALLRLATSDAPPVLQLCPPSKLPKTGTLAALSVGCPAGVLPDCLMEKATGPRKVRRPGIDQSGVFWEVQGAYPAGRSGGPMLDARGYVVGICSGTSGERTYFTHSAEIHSFLQEHGFRWLIPAE